MIVRFGSVQFIFAIWRFIFATWHWDSMIIATAIGFTAKIQYRYFFEVVIAKVKIQSEVQSNA
jgi:hypothetical protein